MSLTSNGELVYNERIRKASQGYVSELSERFLHSSTTSSREELRVEVTKMSAKKAEELFSTEEERRVWIESIRSSVEQSLQNQVRAVLGTPPEVKKKRLHEKKEQEDANKINTITSKQNTVNSKERNFIFLKDSDHRFKFDKDKQLNDFTYEPSSPSLQKTTSFVDPLSDDFNKIFSPYTRAALENISVGSSSNHISRKPLQQPYQRAPGTVWTDCQGTEHELAGPFWPKDHLPLYSNQKHIEYVPKSPEPLYSTGSQRLIKEDDLALFPKPWKGTSIVYNRNNVKLCPTAPTGCLPHLKFESRFECGNLQQAKRVGKCEYDLILTTDLYTKRHTQWYYFRVENMIPGMTYKFNIINLLKRDSLYNYGMKPLLYSQKLASDEQVGWRRTGHSISYTRNTSPKINPLLAKELVYYVLSFQMEFPCSEDVCYLAHCYPYSYSELELYLKTLVDSPATSHHVRKEVLCKTRAGNNCHVLTITSSKVPDNEKLGVVISARVHPGETNASWMMKGVLDYLTCNDPVAESLRQKFVFKIVPMLNPDGVIVGNYRTNLAGKDLNRTFKEPHKDSFPTVWHTKSMLESFKENHQVIIYCDLHGHSRKPNVFMYGCTADPSMGSVSNFLEERLFPWMMSQKAPDKFSFQGCKFIVRKCKESTARVVMWRQLGIMNSFTMEATFCGANFGDMEKGRHFNTHDFEDMGRHFCEVLMEYSEAKSANRNEMTQAFVELACKMTRDILRQSLGNFKKFTEGDILNKQLTNKPYENALKTTGNETEKLQFISSDRKGMKITPSVKDVNFVDVNVQRSLSSKNNETSNNGGDYEVAVKSIHVDSFNDCIKILEGLRLTNCYEESDSSDSDSDPEEVGGVSKKTSSETKKRKKKKRRKQNWWETLSKTTPDLNKDKNVEEEQAKPEERKVKTSFGKFVNPYTNRFNNGIPTYSQERIQERARRKEMEKEEKEKNHDNQQANGGEMSSGTDSVIAFTDNTELNFVTAQRRLTYCMINRQKPTSYVRSVSHPNMTVLPSHATDIESLRMDHLDGGGYGFSVKFSAKSDRDRLEKRESFRETQRHGRPASLQSFEEARSMNGSPSFVEVDPYDIAPFTDVTAERRTRYVPKSTERKRDMVPYNEYSRNAERSTTKDLETMLRLVNSHKSFEGDLLAEFDKLNVRKRHQHKRVVRTKSSDEPSINNRSTIDLRTPLFPSCSDHDYEEKWLSEQDSAGPRFEPSHSIPSYSAIGYASPTTNRKNIFRY